MQDSLFPAPQSGEDTWTRVFDLPGGQSIDVPLYPSLIQGEIRDQISLKSSVRKAALRSSGKTIARLAKRGVAKLTPQEIEELKWSLFICHVDTALGGRHLELRQDPDGQAALAENDLFRAS